MGSFFSGNHPDFNKLPESLACRACPAFYGVLSTGSEDLKVACEWPDGLKHVSMRLNKNEEGGAVLLSGECRHEFGILK